MITTPNLEVNVLVDFVEAETEGILNSVPGFLIATLSSPDLQFPSSGKDYREDQPPTYLRILTRDETTIITITQEAVIVFVKHETKKRGFKINNNGIITFFMEEDGNEIPYSELVTMMQGQQTQCLDTRFDDDRAMLFERIKEFFPDTYIAALLNSTIDLATE